MSQGFAVTSVGQSGEKQFFNLRLMMRNRLPETMIREF